MGVSSVEKNLARINGIFEIIRGEREAELLIDNVKVLDVLGETVASGSILLDQGEIVAINVKRDEVRVKEVFDGKGLFAIPGLIDAHFHFESQLANPVALGDAMVPCGTTTCFVEFLDLIGSAGDQGIKAARELFRDHDSLPYRLFAYAPGKKVSKEIALELLDMEPVIGMGEFDHFTYSKGDEGCMELMAKARSKGMQVNGHWGLTTLSPLELNILPAIGGSNNHDVWNGDDIEKSLRYGFPTQIKFGVGKVENLLQALVNRKFPLENFMFCSDNLSVHHMRTKGHMDFFISKAVAMGIDPIKAIKLATYYTACHFHMEDKLGSITPGRFGDIVLTDSLSVIDPLYVFKGGELVASEGRMLKQVSVDYSSMVQAGVPGLGSFSSGVLEDNVLEWSEDGSRAKVYLFDLFGRGHLNFYREIWLPVVDGKVVPVFEGQGLNRISVVKRYGDDVTNGYFIGVHLDRGAVAVSFPAPVPYFIVIGNDIGEMFEALVECDKYSGAGVVVGDGVIKAVLPIELYGMMSGASLGELEGASVAFDEACGVLGHVNVGEPVINKLLSVFISLHRFDFMKD